MSRCHECEVKITDLTFEVEIGNELVLCAWCAAMIEAQEGADGE